jgi:hypothetical protein
MSDLTSLDHGRQITPTPDPSKRSLRLTRRTWWAFAAMALSFVAATLLGCWLISVRGDDGHCMRTGPSAVRLSVPLGWQVAAYCVDETCRYQSERPAPDDLVDPEPLPTDFVDVSDTASVHQYRIEITSPDGRVLTYVGEVETVGNDFGGEFCRPTMFTAGLSIDRNGELTTQQP